MYLMHIYTCKISYGLTFDVREGTERSPRAVACLHHVITLGALVYLPTIAQQHTPQYKHVSL